MRPRSIVFDLYGDYLRYRGGEARLRVLVRLLESFDVSESTARVVMARLRREDWFATRTVGRETVYELTSKSWQMLDEGRERIFEQSPQAWDGQWYTVIYSVPESDRSVREEMRKELAWLGFGPLATSTWISPHDRLNLVRDRFGDSPSRRLDLLTCRSGGLAEDREMAARCWNLDELNRDYRAFLRHYRPTVDGFRGERWPGRRALVERTRITAAYRRFPFRDPDLPIELLPAGWRGREAREVFLAAHKMLGPAANDYVDELIAGQPGEV